MGHFCPISEGFNYNYPINGTSILFFSFLSEFNTSMSSKGTSVSPVARRIFSILFYLVYLIGRCANINPESTLVSLEWSHRSAV
jgi:hypothetical protein